MSPLHIATDGRMTSVPDYDFSKLVGSPRASSPLVKKPRTSSPFRSGVPRLLSLNKEKENKMVSKLHIEAEVLNLI